MTVKEFRKSARIWRSYAWNTLDSIFRTRCSSFWLWGEFEGVKSSNGETLTAVAIRFQIWAAVKEKARRPMPVFVLGTCRRDWLEERSERLRWCARVGELSLLWAEEKALPLLSLEKCPGHHLASPNSKAGTASVPAQYVNPPRRFVHLLCAPVGDNAAAGCGRWLDDRRSIASQRRPGNSLTPYSP